MFRKLSSTEKNKKQEDKLTMETRLLHAAVRNVHIKIDPNI